jgi:hypothetical protein
MSERKQKSGARWGWRRWLAAAGLGGAVVAAVCWLRWSPLRPAAAEAAPPSPPPPAAAPAPAPPDAAPASDYASRVVAYCNGGPVTREMLGEYLIKRYGAQKLELMVNTLIIDAACKARGVEASGAEIEAALMDDLKGLSLNREQFVNNYLKSHHMTLLEWKEDVIRPKLLMAKLVRDRVQYTEDEVRAAYDAYYGEKIQAQLIIWPKEEAKAAMGEYALLRDNKDEFDRKAKTQPHPELASRGGHMAKPIGRHTTGDESFEKDLFSLQPGEVTQLHESGEGVVIAKCIKRVAPDTAVSLESVRPALVAEIIKKKTLIEIPRYFAEMRKHADPKLLLKDPNKPEDLSSEVQAALANGPGGVNVRPTQAP